MTDHQAKHWYEKWERPISSLSLIGGFVFDAITLKRVDTFLENIWVGVHLGVVALCILLIHFFENEEVNEKDPKRLHFWLVNALQFTFGGILSTFLVFYFRSATLTVSWPFFLILLAAFWANESLKSHYMRLSFQLTLFFLSIFSFAIYIVPVILHKVSPLIFLLSGVASLAVFRIFCLILGLFAHEKFAKSKNIILFSVSGIFLGVTALYFLNLIPPIPISLKDAGIYHSLVRNKDGNYTVEAEGEKGTFSFLNLEDDIHLVAGNSLYAYTAIFSPTSFNTKVIHEWEHYDESQKKWVAASRIELPVSGGRDEGYRTYSTKTNLIPGKWRVNVETPRGEVIGRLRFSLFVSEELPPLHTEIKE